MSASGVIHSPWKSNGLAGARRPATRGAYAYILEVLEVAWQSGLPVDEAFFCQTVKDVLELEDQGVRFKV